MFNERGKLRIILLISGIVLFASFALVTIADSIVQEDLVPFRMFSRAFNDNEVLYDAIFSVGLRSDERFIGLLNEVDLSFHIFKTSRLISIYTRFADIPAETMELLDENWRIYYDYFNGRASSTESDLIKAFGVIHAEIYHMDKELMPLLRGVHAVFFAVHMITLLFFLFLLFILYRSPFKQGQDDSSGLSNVRNALIQGQEQERLRISLELHDKVAQDLFACRMIINELKENAVDEGSSEAYKKSLTLMDSSIQEVRDLSYNLRPPALQAIGLDSAMQSYIDNFSKKTDININYKAVGFVNKEIDESISINLYRILQETMNNTVKHAHAENIDVKLLYTYPYLMLKIDDDGVGFKYVKSEVKVKGRNNLGLPGIKERVSLLGGELIINTGKGEGTKILIKVPLEANEKV